MTTDVFSLFVSRKFDEILDLIARGEVSDLDANGPEQGWTLLHHAAERQMHAFMQSLVQSGANIDARDDYGSSPLFWSFFPETVATLIDLGANIHHRNKWGRTPIFSLSVNDETEALHILVNAGADINAKDDDGDSPLMHFIRENNSPVCALELIGIGAVINTINNCGDTALHIAAENCHFQEVIEALLKAGADPSVLNAQGQTPSEVTEDEDYKALLQRAALNRELSSLIESATAHPRRADGGI